MGRNVLNAEFVAAQQAIARADLQDEKDHRAELAIAGAALNIGRVGVVDHADADCAHVGITVG